jgi:hypothetical protein
MEIFSDYDLGSKLNFHYQNAKPFPNIIIDDFINPVVAMQCFSELKNTNFWVTEDGNNPYMTDNQVNKWFTPWDDASVEQLRYETPTVSTVLRYFNSPIFLQFLKDLTGIPNLIPDPHLWGGGCHKINNGGRLNLHVDYNINPLTEKFDTRKSTTSLSSYLRDVFSNQYLSFLLLKDAMDARDLAP